MRYEVTRHAPGQDTAEPTVTDAAGVTELVRLAALNGIRVHIRPIADPADAGTSRSRSFKAGFSSNIVDSRTRTECDRTGSRPG